ncbi:cellulose synthase [Thermostaphylospora chromogena]|uniref:Cellulose synthase n=1 Tax=Thermostaphylospora chromogena TaxID=35622 RepID=A0A1H1HIQ4_9ACTN|nr:cellulose synthase [Thermostaphylospora chromogena]SDR25277.1 hypothetical protein SAMN04489764_4482 [Thermostaphylospora chromogena]
MTYDQIAWLPLCAGLTGVGLVVSFLLLRRRGAASGLRMAAWSLLPLAAYLTGALPTLWRIGTAVVGFVTGLVFSPAVWAGVALAGLSVVLFLVSGVLRGRARDRAAAPAERGRQGVAASQAKGVTAGGSAAGASADEATRPMARPAKKPAADDDFSDIEEILKRRGIT